MKASTFMSRNKIKSGLKGKSRYVSGTLHSHRRPVETPYEKQPLDDPEFRGLTTDNEFTDYRK